MRVMGEQYSEHEDESTAVQPIELTELDDNQSKGRRLFGDNMGLIHNVKVRLTVSVGQSQLTVKELLDLKENSTLSLDKPVEAPVDILLDGKLVARGDLVAVDDNFGVRISEIVSA